MIQTLRSPVRLLSFRLLSFSAIGLGTLGWTAGALAQTASQTASKTAPAPIAQASAAPAALSPLEIADLVRYAAIAPNDVVYEIGGDGQVALAALKQTSPRKAVRLTQQTNLPAADKGLQTLNQDPLQANLSDATVVILRGNGASLAGKLFKDLAPNTRIVALGSNLGEWQPDETRALSSAPQSALKLSRWVVPAKVAGTWKGSFALTATQSKAFTLTFVQKFQKVTGNVQVDKTKVDFSKAEIKGDRLSFSHSDTVQGQPISAKFSGKVEGNSLKGSIAVQSLILNQSFPVSAKRGPQP
jgi:hypothetical protein